MGTWYIAHSGVAHDENPPGRGSGRYPFGSGKRPFQGVKTGNNITKEVTKLQDKLKTIKYDNSNHKLKSPSQTIKDKSGNCHDQTLLMQKYLNAKGIKNTSLFVMEFDPKNNQGGMTHSFVVLKNKDGKLTHIDNPINGRKGVSIYDNIDDCINDINLDHMEGMFGDSKKYSELIFLNFKGQPGDTLQQIVEKSLRDDYKKHNYPPKID